MKKLLFFSFAILFALTACNKDKDKDNEEQQAGLNPTQDQWGFVFEYTRVNCSTCGSLGGPLLHDLHAQGKVVCVAAHVNGGNDPMETSFHNPVYSDRPHDGGIPFFWVGNTSCARSQNDAMAAMTALKAKTPEAGVDLTYTIEGTTMTVETKTKFFSTGTGEYLISVFVLEDDIPGGSANGAYNQAGAGDDYKHQCVLRDVSTGSFYGENLASSPAKDSEYEKSYTFTLDGDWNSANCYAVAVIWKFDNSLTPEHYFINAKEYKE